MIRLESLTLGYGRKILLREVNADLDGGGLMALLGRNGTGKSTLLRAMAGLGSLQGGRILLDGKVLTDLRPEELARTVAFVTTERVRVPDLKCRDVVALGRAPYTGWTGRLQPHDHRMVEEALDWLGMSGYADRTLDRMSDGECQRIMIARALAQSTTIILLDEPTSFLDLPNRYELCTLLAELAHSHGKCIVFSTHELDIAVNLADDIALIDTPHLLHMPVCDMLEAGHIARVFNAAGKIPSELFGM